jgi:hypothetical protein
MAGDKVEDMNLTSSAWIAEEGHHIIEARDSSKPPSPSSPATLVAATDDHQGLAIQALCTMISALSSRPGG